MMREVLAFFALFWTCNAVAQEDTGLEAAKRAASTCAAKREGANPLLPDVRIPDGGTVLCIEGGIDWRMASAVDREISAAGTPVHHVVITSDGGEVVSALRIAERIAASGAAVVVRDRCASSCAQFLFMAAARKYILKGGLLAFHGGPLSEERLQALDVPEAARSTLRAEQVAFRRFYEERGLDMAMLTRPPADVQAEINRGHIVMWTWSPAELAGFGVTGVVAEDE